MNPKRLRTVRRDQIAFRGESLEQLLPPEHAVRALWDYVSQLDVTAFLDRIAAVPHEAGAPAYDPRVLITLWIQATLDGVGSARRVAELCENHLVYRWICGDDPIRYRTLSNFRVGCGEALDGLLTQSVAVLCHSGAARLNRVAQDGMKVRASAGAGSFRREKTLREHLKEAEEQVAALKSQSSDDADSGAASRRSEAARQRGAEDRARRLKQALSELDVLKSENAARAADPSNRHRAKDPAELRASETDPEARRMKMSDGGFRPAFNVQFATTTEGGAIAGVIVTNAGTDSAQMGPMLDQLESRYAVRPGEVLVDGGFAAVEEIAAADQSGTVVYAPLKDEQKQLDAGKDPYAKKRKDAPAVAAWRARMGTDRAKAIYRERAATAEWSNAQARNRGLQRFSVRGLAKALHVATWFAVAHNASRWWSLGVSSAATG